VCTARKLSPAGDFHSFSSCFEDRALDERAHIRTVVGAAALESHEVYPKSEEFWQEFERLLWHQDEPVASTNVYAQWCVMRAARQANIPVLLDGQGGDETLCGYMKFYIFHLSNLLRRADWRFIPEVIAWSTSGTRSHFSWEDATKYIPHSFGRVSPVAKVTHPEFRHQFARSGVAFRVGQTVQARQLGDINTFSLPALLHYEDRNSMAHSIETRLPFLDYELVQFLVNCRSSLKLRKGWSKWLLRRALSGTIPESIRLRKNKLGFDSPQTQWLRKALKKGMAESAFDGNLRMNKFLSRKNLLNEARKVADNKRGAIPASVLFRALTLEKWARVHDVSS
jgi:asparagine synthase (glutamine-hydrolysing)